MLMHVNCPYSSTRHDYMYKHIGNACFYTVLYINYVYSSVESAKIFYLKKRATCENVFKRSRQE